MFRNKRWMALAAACLMAGSACAESDNILYTTTQKQANYETVAVTRGTFEQVYSQSASPYYPYVHNLRIEVSGARFKEYTVKSGDTVTAGTVLMTFDREVDTVGLEKKRISLIRSEEAFEKRKAQYDEEITSLAVQIIESTDPWERDMLTLKMTRKELERDKYIMETERSIANARASLEEMEADCAVTQLIAPVDGEVKILAYKQEGDRIGSNEVVMTITEPHGMIFLIDNSNGYFRYGMNVRMEVGTNSNRVELQGRIVATDILIPEARRQNIAFLEVDVSKLKDVKLTRAQAYAQVYYLENVLTVPKEAVTLAGGQYYVTMLIDGTPAKRFINFVKNSRDATLLFDGADEGDLVILD